jgi:hypothetical protein
MLFKIHRFNMRITWNNLELDENWKSFLSSFIGILIFIFTIKIT